MATATPEKVQFGLKKCYYALKTEDGYDTPVELPGAVNINLSPAGDKVEFYADDELYFGEEVNNGYDGDLELALIPESFKKDVLGEELNSDGILMERATATQKSFALLFELTTDKKARRIVYYNCLAGRPAQAGSTKTSTKDVKTETISLTIRPNTNGDVKAVTTQEANATKYNAWYTAVYEEVQSA